MVKIFDNIYTESSIVYEFLSSMLRVQCQEEMIPEDTKDKKYISQDVFQWVEKVKNSMSDELKKELKVFFNKESFLGLGLIPLVWKHKKHKDIEEFFVFIKEDVSGDEIVKGFFANGYKKDNMDGDYIKNISSLEKAMDFINQLNLPEEEKWNLLYFYQNPKETKERLLKLMEDFYNQFFVSEMEKVSGEHSKNIEKIREELLDDGYNKMRKVLAFEPTFIKELKELVFIASYFHGIGSITSQISKDSLLIIYGINRLESILEREDKIDVIEALKIISDEKRVKIIKLLNESSYYGYEIGQRLGLSNSTISHHLGLLTHHKIIHPIRLENKIYYEVDKDKIKEILKMAEVDLTGR